LIKRIGQASCLTVPLFSKEGLGEIILLSNPPLSPFRKGGGNGGPPLIKVEAREYFMPGTGFPSIYMIYEPRLLYAQE
jgi:hypothetical protein